MLIVREAGGIFSDFSGKMTGLDGSETLASNALIYNEILEITRSFMEQKSM